MENPHRAPRSEPELEGRLNPLSLTDVLQVVASALPRAEVRVMSTGVVGALDLRDGLVVGARCGHLVGFEAGLAIFGLREGRFAVHVGTGDADRPIASVTELLLESARLEDELDRRRENVPARGTRLTCRVATVAGDELQCGVQVVASALGVPRTLETMEAELPLCPLKVRLAVATLRELGLLSVRASATMSRVTLPDAPPWLRSALTRHRGALRVLVACPSATGDADVSRALAEVAALVGAEAPAVRHHSQGPTFVRLRSHSGSVLSFTFLPLERNNRVFFESFVRTTDVVILTESEHTAAWSSSVPRAVRATTMPSPTHSRCLVDALDLALRSSTPEGPWPTAPTSTTKS